MSLTFLQFETHTVFQEGERGFLYVGGDGVVVARFGLDEHFQGADERLNIFHNVLTESKCLNTTVSNICLRLGRVHLESQLMRAVEVEDLKVLDLGVSEQNGVIAYSLFWVLSGDDDIECGLVDTLILEIDLFEAPAFVGGLWV